jgi:hypothetical protein
MIRPFTLLTMILAMVSGAYLFAVKHRAQVLDDQFAAVANQTQLDEQRIRVLQAQWSLEIDPTRLARLAHQFTGLQPMKPAQLIAMVDLANLLPPPGSPIPGVNPVAPIPAMPANDPSPVASAAPAAPLPLPPKAAPVLLANAASHPGAPGHAHLLPQTPRQTPRQAPRQELANVARHPALHSHIASDEFAENLPPPRPVRSAYPMGAQVMSVRATTPEAGSGNGSALAMGADLAPPQPLGAGANN